MPDADAWTTTPTTARAAKKIPLEATKMSNERIKSAGGGLALIPAGDRHLFDPAKEGKLGGTTTDSDCDRRIALGVSYTSSSSAERVSPLVGQPALGGSGGVVVVEDAQHWLEDIGVPVNTYKPTAPTQSTVLGRARLIRDDAPGDIQHVVLRLPNGMHYVEGQSLSVIPPGVDSNKKPYKPRLYSIASTRYGDLLDGTTVSLCVRRAEYTDPVTGVIDATKKGICSNFLCDVQPGTVVNVAGPVGKTSMSLFVFVPVCAGLCLPCNSEYCVSRQHFSTLCALIRHFGAFRSFLLSFFLLWNLSSALAQ
jgi:hypothetical protein